MRIAVDIRSLLEPFPSGVTQYTSQLLEAMLAYDRANSYELFSNGRRRLPVPLRGQLTTERSTVRESAYPNRLLNAAVALTGWPRVSAFVSRPDVLFLPTLQFVAVPRRLPYVLTIHDLSFAYSGWFSWRGQWWHRAVHPRRLISGASIIIAVSENTKQDVIERYGIAGDRVRVVYPGVERERFADVSAAAIAAAQQRYRLHQPYVLYVGSLTERKNIDGLLRAWPAVGKALGGAVELVCAGQMGTTLPKALPAGVRLLGYTAEEHLPALLRGARVFVYPSHFEGFGMPPLEAMAAGVPVVTSHATSLPEVVATAAVQVDPYSTMELAAVLSRLFQDGQWREELITRGRERVAQFRWETAARETVNILYEATRL